ncbi:hypothetical protein EUX98_g9312 [Antrodiella citrinella]|uniref:Phosphatases II n=1 Tax=Antrodiella citrinella TaxID=2447956 RepID=A0A4S4LV83_9APHY|nr:hypothetical protein EUX98_g9312 [Antrodiella citrinella]
MSARKGINRAAQSLTTLSKEEQEVHRYSIAIATHPDNAPGNRYTGVEPYDRTLVNVGCGDDSCEPTGRYLNASWVRELYGGKWWIATQAPLPETFHAYLSMIFQPTSHPPAEFHPRPKSFRATDSSRIRTIVVLTRNMEGGRRKAHPYVPTTEGDTLVSPPEEGVDAPSYEVTLVKATSIEEAHAVQSIVAIQPIDSSGAPIGEPVTFNHLFFSDWPDHGVPEAEYHVGLLKFVKLVDEVNRDISLQPAASRAGLDPDPPIMINCSAGVGRTGTFIALSSLLREAGMLRPVASTVHDASAALPELEPSLLGPLPEQYKEDKAAQEVDALREQRTMMVQKEDQMGFLYDSLLLAYELEKKGSDTASIASRRTSK